MRELEILEPGDDLHEDEGVILGRGPVGGAGDEGEPIGGVELGDHALDGVVNGGHHVSVTFARTGTGSGSRARFRSGTLGVDRGIREVHRAAGAVAEGEEEDGGEAVARSLE
ncbi:hypothetical protein B296_00056891 [Ensete ventricosum]|uniref:Uncharacterized protein n=1 Tax=Ensete ventricosum TaxID=4639 RepID=A0A426XTD0_ENSVE|nr:hypothetical protein B296_00056891 [Ensete ventricosum]